MKALIGLLTLLLLMSCSSESTLTGSVDVESSDLSSDDPKLASEPVMVSENLSFM